MGKLQDRMETDLRLLNRSPRTIQSYLSGVRQLARFYRRSPDSLSVEEVRAYLLHRKQVDKVSDSTLRLDVYSLRFFYGRTLGRRTFAAQLPLPRVRQRLPEVPTREEMRRLLATASRRDRALLCTAYATGLRLSEVTRLQVGDIDAEAGLLRIHQGKGGKDRVVPLSEALLGELRAYWRAVRPRPPWLFSSRKTGGSLSPRAAQRILAETARRAGIARPLSCERSPDPAHRW